MKSILLFCLTLLLVQSCKDIPDTTNACCAKTDTVPMQPLSENAPGIYQLDGTWLDQQGKSVHLTDLRGKIQVVAMIFSSCQLACPRIVGDMQAIESKLTRKQVNEVGFVLVSFDPERDTPEKLQAFAKEMGLNENWRLLHGSDDMVRQLSLVLDVKYEKQADGSFAHSNVINILSTEGQILFRQEGLGVANQEALMAINKNQRYSR